MSVNYEEGSEDERTAYKELAFLSPLEVERNELGYQLDEFRGKALRVIRNDCIRSTGCIFFVHGGGGRGGQFKHQFKALKRDFQLVAFDFLGHGDSPKPNRPQLYTANEHFEDLLAIYERYKKAQNVLVSHCYGCIHTLRLLKYLNTKNRLGEISGVVFMAIGGNAPSGSSVSLFTKLPSFFLEWVRPLARSAANSVLWSPTCDPAIIEFENAISYTNRMYMMKVIGADCADQARWEQWLAEGQEAMTASTIPLAMICGESDGIFSVQSCEHVRSLLEVPGNCFHVVKDSAHNMMIEKPVEVTRIIRDFVLAEAKLVPVTTTVQEQ